MSCRPTRSTPLPRDRVLAAASSCSPADIPSPRVRGPARRSGHRRAFGSGEHRPCRRGARGRRSTTPGAPRCRRAVTLRHDQPSRAPARRGHRAGRSRATWRGPQPSGASTCGSSPTDDLVRHVLARGGVDLTDLGADHMVDVAGVDGAASRRGRLEGVDAEHDERRGASDGRRLRPGSAARHRCPARIDSAKPSSIAARSASPSPTATPARPSTTSAIERRWRTRCALA